jgi:hypothetical protein
MTNRLVHGLAFGLGKVGLMPVSLFVMAAFCYGEPKLLIQTIGVLAGV